MISDLHVGTRLRRDLLRHSDAVRALAGALEGVDRLVLLGDTLELRDRPRPEVLEVAAAELDDDDPLGYALAVYDFLTWLQETLASAMLR